MTGGQESALEDDTDLSGNHSRSVVRSSAGRDTARENSQLVVLLQQSRVSLFKVPLKSSRAKACTPREKSAKVDGRKSGTPLVPSQSVRMSGAHGRSNKTGQEDDGDLAASDDAALQSSDVK